MKIGEKEIEVKEIKYKDVIAFSELSLSERAKKLILATTNLTEEEYNHLGLKEGMQLDKLIGAKNDLEDFLKPLKD